MILTFRLKILIDNKITGKIVTDYLSTFVKLNAGNGHHSLTCSNVSFTENLTHYVTQDFWSNLTSFINNTRSQIIQ